MGDEGKEEKRARKGGVGWGRGRAVKERRKEVEDMDKGGEEEGK